MQEIEIEINGITQTLHEGLTLRDYIESQGLLDQHGVAVAINGKVILRQAWDTTPLRDGDKLMLLKAAQGG